MSRPRILITYPFPLGQATGGARMTREIARYMGRSGADVTILPISCAPWSWFRRRLMADRFVGRQFDKELAQDSVSIRRVEPSRFHWLRDGLAAARAVDHILQKEKVDLVLSYFTEAAAVAPAVRAHGVKFGIIATVQSYEHALGMSMKGIPGFLQPLINKRVIANPLRQADIIYATSEYTRDEVTGLFDVDPAKIVVTYLGVEPPFFEIPRAAPERINRFLFTARVVPMKGVLDAIEALGKLAKNGFTDWTFRMFGDGNRGWVEDAARENGVGSQVEVCAALLDDEALFRQLEWAHVMIAPSHFEAFGLAFAEAQAAGLPVVAYQAGAVPEIVEDGVTGWLAPVHDIDGLSQAIERATEDPAATHQAGLAGRERNRRFSWEETVRTMARGFREVCGADLGLQDKAPTLSSRTA